MRGRTLLAAAAALALIGTAPHPPGWSTGTFKIDLAAGPYVAGSRLAVTASGVQGRVALSVLGPGRIDDGAFVAPQVARETAATIIGSARGAIALRNVSIVPAPAPKTPLLAVATYRDGIALHDPRTFRLIGYAAVGGAPGDVAFDGRGRILAPDTDGDSLAEIGRAPWQVRSIAGVSTGNEVAVDRANGDVFVTDRSADGHGALTRITPRGEVTRIRTGDTAEGLVVDATRGLVYVGNVNSSDVAVVNARTMGIVRTIPSVPRTFGMALDEKTQRLFVVSNTSPTMPQRGGYVAAIDLRGRKPRIVARSAKLYFPIGAALDRSSGRLFVTDEAKDAVYVLSAKNLHAVHSPLQTCSTPWRPRIAGGRLYVPCAGADKVDVFDLRSLRRVKGAPFTTGGFPLSVALWH